MVFRKKKGMVNRMEYTIKALKAVFKFIVLVACVGLIMIGQKNIGYQGLVTMIGGLGGIIILLYCYNRKYQ